jgi:phosphatidylglycerol---prolipoprotein diacylglyceryl transferase
MDPLASLTSLAAIGWEIIDRFHIGDRFAVSPHGVGIALGYLAGAYVFMRESARRGYPEDASSSIVFWALIGAIVGARVGYVITHLGEFDNPADVLAIWRGGISQLGGVVGAIAVSYVVVRRRGLSFLGGLDAAAIPIPLGVVIGRVGDLIIGDHLGSPTSWALAWTYHGGNLAGYNCVSSVCTTGLAEGKVQIVTPAMAELRGPAGDVLGQGLGVHQTALYDFIATMGLVLLLVYLNRNPRRAGILFFTYIAWYGAGRIITDFLRVENRFFGLTGSQWTSLVAVALAGAMLVWYAVRPQRTAAPDLEVTGGG